MRGTIGETLERLILLQIGAASATRDRVERVVEDLIRQGRIEREEGRTVVNDVMKGARERSSGTRSLFDASVQQGLRTAGVPNREAYEDLLFRVEQLEHRLRLLESLPTATQEARERVDRGVGVSAATAPAAEGVPEGPLGAPGSATPPVGGVDVAPQPPRDEPGTAPGLPPRP